jgi:hypothetical protein
MVIVVSVLVLAALVALIVAVVDVVRRVTRWALRPSAPTPGRTVVERTGEPPPYGGLPTPADPVGALGGLSPDADLGDPGASSREMHGE